MENIIERQMKGAHNEFLRHQVGFMMMVDGRTWEDRQGYKHPLPPQPVFNLIGFGETPEKAQAMARRHPSHPEHVVKKGGTIGRQTKISFDN